MSIPIYQVDAFTDKAFSGNPAAVCILKRPADKFWMQSVAMEMNLSETAFVMRRECGGFDLRWFTPSVEVALCGHATLATSHVLWETKMIEPEETVKYHTKSGILQAQQVDKLIELDFPAILPENCGILVDLTDALGLLSAVYVGQTRSDYLVEVASEDIVRGLAPDFAKLKCLGVFGVMVTARSESEDFDFVSRFFGPGVGIDEDPVTGSAHCVLTPYWAGKLSKTTLFAYQASARGGKLKCTLANNRVKLAGKALTVLRGELTV